MRRVRFRKWWKEIKVFSLLAGIVLIVSYEVILTSLCIDIPNLSKFSITSGFYSVHRLFDNSEAMGALLLDGNGLVSYIMDKVFVVFSVD